MLGSEHHGCGTEKGVGSGGENLDGVSARSRKADFRPFGTSDPIPLHGFNGIGPI